MKSIMQYRDLIYEDLKFNKSVPYNANPQTPIHRWFLLPESSSLEWAKVILSEAGIKQFDYVLDPFCGSGTVGLQSILFDVNFIGGDRLSDVLVGAMAKLGHKIIEKQNMTIFFEELTSYIEFICNNTMDITRTVKNVKGATEFF